MSYFSNEKRFEDLIAKPKDISILLKKDMFLISGDFYGIQKFIFDRLSTKNASKVLRAKSAFIQIFTEYLARYICHKLNINEDSIISMNAGKFEILSDKEIDLDSIQKKIDEYFIKNFYGLSGVMISSVKCKDEDFKDTKRYKELRKKIIDSVEDKKFQKFNLFKEDAFDILEYDTNIDNSTLCPICNIRKVEDKNCFICDSFIKLGKRLSKDSDELVFSNQIGIDFDDNFVIKIRLSPKIKSYTLFDGYSPADFKVLADNSCQELETGIKSLAVLKADVDNMGKFLEKSDVTNSFENFDTFSRTMDEFFSIYIPNMMRNKYPNTYTVFAGGDDLFLLGAWDEVLNLAREVESEFKSFVKGDDLSISFGIAIAKPTTPISYLADYTEKLLEDAKDIDDGKEVAHPKDAISLFGETVKWEEYKRVYNLLNKQFKNFEVINTSNLYTLLNICDMSKNIKEDIRNSLWKSKLNYLFSRNIDTKYHYILKVLNEEIEKSPEATKMFLSEFIYKRRRS